MFGILRVALLGAKDFSTFFSNDRFISAFRDSEVIHDQSKTSFLSQVDFVNRCYRHGRGNDVGSRT